MAFPETQALWDGQMPRMEGGLAGSLVSAAAGLRHSDACGSAWTAQGLALLFDAPLVVWATEYCRGQQTDECSVRWLFGPDKPDRKPIVLGLQTNVGRGEETGHFYFISKRTLNADLEESPRIRRSTPGLKGGMEALHHEGSGAKKRKSQKTSSAPRPAALTRRPRSAG